MRIDVSDPGGKRAVVLDTMTEPVFLEAMPHKELTPREKRKQLANATQALCDSFKGRHTIFHVSATSDHVCIYSTEPVDADTRYAMQLLAGQPVSLLFRVAMPKQVM
jgi:hypothetical protein